MRGKRSVRLKRIELCQITPAGAGKTPKRRFCTIFNRGSPPQVRGKPITNYRKIIYDRITPAGAGKTSCWSRSAASTWDHPRRCGENIIAYIVAFVKPGSPPQVRGKLIHIPPSSQGKRITPAGAGKTFVLFGSTVRAWDHPRRCGENDLRLVRATYATGSPPQVRGKRG